MRKNFWEDLISEDEAEHFECGIEFLNGKKSSRRRRRK